MEDELDLIIQNMVSAGESEDNIALVINSYNSEKKKSTPTSTHTKSVSGTPTGSSVGVNPAFKNTTPSPIPDFNAMQSVKSVAQKPQVKLQKPPVKEEDSFFDYLKENLDTGLATVSKSVYDAPGFIYDAAASVTNPIFRAMGVGEDKLASSDKLANDLGFKNIPSEILKEKINVSNEKINAYSAKNGGDALQAVQDGNYVGAAKLVAGTTAQSLPIMVAAMASGGQTSALTAIGVSTASTKNAQLKEENPEMGLGTRVLNSANAGIIEAVTGHLFTGASGAVMKKIIADKGVEAGSKIIGKSFRTTIEKSIEKNPLVSAVGEVVEESAVEFGNQVNDMSSGIRAEFDFHAIKNAGLSATGMGGLQTLGVYGAKGYVKAKDYAKLKATNKEVFKLRSEIDNGNLSPENKAILSLRADRLEAENKQTLGFALEKAKALPTEAKTELNALNVEFEDLKTKFDDIDDADDIPENLKPAMKEEIKLQAAKNQKRKTEILSQNDGLEIDNDFSKFEGVEPDFDLENGKISSLPLKEQDRLNDLALQELTGGDMSIEVTKEQVSQKANEIYANEQNPQAEVPQQAEAEKVDKKPTIVVHGAVNGFGLQYSEGIDEKDIVTPQDARGFLPQEDQVSLNKGNSVVQEDNVSDNGDKKISILTPSTDSFGRSSVNNFEFTIPTNNTSTTKGIQSILDDVRNGDLSGKELIDETVKQVKKYIDSNEIIKTKETPKLQATPPVEDVVAPSVEKPSNLQISEKSSEQEIFDFVNNDLQDKKETSKSGNTFISGKKDGFKYDIEQNSEGNWRVTRIIDDKGKKVYDFIDKLLNEKPQEGDITPNASIRPTATNVGESGITEQESPAKEGVSKPVDGGEGKGDASVEKNSIFGSMENTAKALDETDNKGLVKLIKDVIFHGTASKFKEFKITNISSGAIKIPNTIFFTNNETRAFSFSKSAKNNIIDDIHRIMWWGNKEAMFNTKSNIDSNLNNNNDISKKALKDLNEYFKSIGYEDLGLKTKADISKLINKIESGELETSRVIGVKIKEGAKTLVIDNNKDWQSILANYKFGDSKGSLKKIYQKYDVLIHKNTTDFPLSGNKELMDKSRLGDNIIVLNPKFIQNIDSQYISEQYHKAKADGTNPELVKAVEDAIGKPTETPQPKSKGDASVGENNYEIEPYYKLHPKLSKEDLDNFDYISDAVMTGDYEFLPDGYSIKTMKSYRENARNYVEVEVTNPKGDKFYIRENTFDLRDENFTVTTKPKSEGKQIEPHKEVNTDVETVKKELNLSDVDNLIYDEFKDTPKNEEEIYKKLEKVNDNLYGKVEEIEGKIDDIDTAFEKNGEAIDKINDDESLSHAKKKKAVAVLEKEYKDLQKQQKDLESEKENVEQFIKDVSDKLYDWEAEENVSIVNGIVDKVNNRLETRKSIKEGTNLFPEDANIPEFIAIKKELIKLTDEKTIADFNSRTAEQVKESEPIIADIKSKAENAERISKKELEKGIADAEALIKNELEDINVFDKNISIKNKKGEKVDVTSFRVINGHIVGVSGRIEVNGILGKQTFISLEFENSELDKLDIEGVNEGVKPNNEGVKKPPTTKERIAERIKLSDAKIDENSEIVKAKLKAFTDMFPSADINPDDYHTNGFSADAIIDMVAKAAKAIAKGGIVTSEHIKQAIAGYNTIFDDKIDPKLVEEKINPKVEEEKKAENDFKSKSGKKSLLGRLIKGGNPDVITKAVKELGENYDVRNQQEANDEAMVFIDKVGASEALKAIKDGLIKNSDVKMLIYDEAINRLKIEISDEMNNNPEDREALIKKFQEVSDEFDRAIRDAGQGIAIMNYIYNKNQTLKYNLSKQINDWKRNDPNGEIPADVKAKFEELNQKLKDIEERTKDAEERAKKAEEELAIKNIQEDVERKNQAARKNKSGLTPQEQSRKKQLRDKFARANDVTGIPALLVDPEFREYLGLVLKTAKGDFSNFSNEILKELGKSARQHLPELFANAGGKGDVKVTDLQSITIDKEGKIKIPAQMLRDYVEQGYTDIDEIATLIKDDIADEFPDADVRDIRDALTGYGKQINPNKDEITAEVNKLKEYGRLLSAYDDVMNGKMPLKSGLTRPKPEQKVRELRRNINRLAKELNLEQVDTEKQWANAIDKVKTHLKNQIEDLDKQIANGEKRKVERTSIKFDEEATALKGIRDAKKQILDDLVGKPELTEAQKIASAEKSLETSIGKIQDDIYNGEIEYKEKPTPATSKKIEALKKVKQSLLESKKQLRQEAGLIEQQRLKTTKTRIKNQIEDLNTRIKNKDFAKKEVKPILADNELNTLRAEKEAVYEEYEKMKYLQELKNRTFAKKMMDEGLEALGLARAVKASLDLGLIGIQLRGFTYSELWRNPKELGHKFVKMFGAIGSQNKTNKAMSELIGHPLHALAKKLDIGMTHPDLRNEVREEMASGNLLHFIWSSPVLAAERLGGRQFMNSKRSSIGDSFINSVKTQYNKLFQNYQVDIKQKDKFSIKEQWKNVNAFEAVERGLSIYGNQLRFEEFVRGVDRLKAEGKDEINHLEDYKALASYIRTFSGRAKPAGFELNQKALNVFFFSFKNMASVIQQLNPIYYGIQHARSTDFKNGNYFKPSVANKMAMATMFKSVTSTAATLLFVMAAYNSFKDDDEEEATIEKDPRSSDFGKLKIGNFRYDPWGGYIPLISLYARLLTEETKKADGSIVKFGEGFGGIQNRGDAASRFLINKESPGFQMFHKYMTSTEEVDKATGETYRATPFGGKLSEEDAYSFYPIFLGSVKQAKEKDYEGVQAFLTAYSILGLGNVQEYESKAGATPEDSFLKSQEKKKAQFDLPETEKQKIRVDDKLSRAESKIKMIDEIKIAQKMKLPYYISKDVYLTKEEVADMDLESGSKGIEEAKKEIKAIKLEYKIKD